MLCLSSVLMNWNKVESWLFRLIPYYSEHTIFVWGGGGGGGGGGGILVTMF